MKTKKIIVYSIIVFFIVAILFCGFMFYKSNSVLAVIGIDINPSLELKINSNNKVVNVVTNNDDAKKIVGDMDLTGSNLDVAVNALMGSMLKNGYINQDENSILISLVDGNYDVKDLANNVYNYLESETVKPSVLVESGNTTDYDKELANKYNISVSKVKLINSIVSSNNLYKFEDLVKFNTNELNLLLNNSNTENVNIIGNASKAKYKTLDEVKKIVFAHAKIDGSKASNIDIEYDYNLGQIVYDIEFDYNNNEYNYEVNATTGEIIEYEVDQNDDFITNQANIDNQNNNSSNNNTNNNTNNSSKNNSNNSNNAKYISKNEAKNIAFKRVNVSNASSTEIEFKYKSGLPIYEVEFYSNGNEYDFTINAQTGEILYYDVNDKSVSNQKYISKEKVKSIVLSNSKVTNYRDYEIELDTENGKVVYEVSFDAGNKEYDYKIDAITGKILSKEIDD